jgi:hypothetical protein
MKLLPRSLQALTASVSFAALSAHALLITPTYDPSSTFTVAEKASVAAAAAEIGALFSDPITVKINFTNNAVGLGGSSPVIFAGSYAVVRNLLLADSTTAADATAYATLGAVDPFFNTISFRRRSAAPSVAAAAPVPMASTARSTSTRR